MHFMRLDKVRNFYIFYLIKITKFPSRTSAYTAGNQGSYYYSLKQAVNRVSSYIISLYRAAKATNTLLSLRNLEGLGDEETMHVLCRLSKVLSMEKIFSHSQ